MPLRLHHTTQFLIAFLPVGLLLVPSGGSTTYHLLALIGLLALLHPGITKHRPFTQWDKVAMVGYLAFVVTIIISLVHADFRDEAVGELDTFLRPLWALLILYLLIVARVSTQLFWLSLLLGAYIAGLNALYEALVLRDGSRVEGAMGPITYGDLALLMGFMAAVGVNAMPQRHQRGYWFFSMGGLMLALLASLLSGARGGWVTLPVLIPMLLYTYWQWGNRQTVYRLAVYLPLLLLAGIAVPQTGVMERLAEAHVQLANYWADPVRHGGTSVGLRFELWRAAWDAFMANPWLGGGLGHSFNAYLQQGIAAGQYHPATGVQTMPHNLILDLLAIRGLVGLLGVVVMWGCLAWVFVKAQSLPDTSGRAFGYAGIMLLVGYFLFGLTDSTMEYGDFVTFFCFYSLLAVYGINESQPVSSQPAGTVLQQ